MENKVKIAVVATGGFISSDLGKSVSDFVARAYGDRVDLAFDPQCFLQQGHFAGSDEDRLEAFVAAANDPSVDVVWFARGGYGTGRMALDAVPRLTEAARRKIYMGYSDIGYLLAVLYRHKIGRVFHGPMASDFLRADGEQAVRRALDFFVAVRDGGAMQGVEADVDGSAPVVAFNMVVLSQMVGTKFMPDLSGHIVMLEEVGEYMYRIDRTLCHLMNSEALQKVCGVRLGRCSLIPENDPPFQQAEDVVMRFWCEKAGLNYLGRADIGHDSQNKIVPFGCGV